MRYLLLLLFLTSCSSESSDRYKNTGYIDLTYIEHYKEFIHQSKIRGLDYSHISIEIVNSDIEIPARCLYKIKRVELNPEMIIYYETLFAGYTELVIFHELGHCILNLDHQGEGIMRGNFPVWFVMNYLYNKEELLDELFKRKIINK